MMRSRTSGMLRTEVSGRLSFSSSVSTRHHRRRTQSWRTRLSSRSQLIHILYACALVLVLLARASFADENVPMPDSTLTVPPMRWIHVPTTNPPPGIRDFAIGYLPKNAILVFGGTSQSGDKNGETYILSLDDMAWQPPDPSPAFDSNIKPTARSNMIFGTDLSGSYRQVIFIGGGLGVNDEVYNDMWAYETTYNIWGEVTVSTQDGEPVPKMYSAYGGIDYTTPNEGNNTMIVVGGTDGNQFFGDSWAVELSGTLSTSKNSVAATWNKLQSSGKPPKVAYAGSAILPNGRIAVYGGCHPKGNCKHRQSYSFAWDNPFDPHNVTANKLAWREMGLCPGPAHGSAFAMNPRYSDASATGYQNQAILFSGNGTESDEEGTVSVLNVNGGTWVRVRPDPDPKKGYPAARTGAQMIALPQTVDGVGDPSDTDRDILLFGGERINGTGGMLNDVWILRMSNEFVTYEDSENSTFVGCVPISEDEQKDIDGDGDDDSSSGSLDAEDVLQHNLHVNTATISFVLLPLAVTVIRFGYGAELSWLIGITGAVPIIASYATAITAFVSVHKDRDADGLKTAHGYMGAILLVLLYIVVPIMGVITWAVNRKFASYPSSTPPEEEKSADKAGDEESDRGIFKRIFSLFRFGNPSTPVPPSFEVSRPPRNSAIPRDSTSTTSEAWRRSVTISDTPSMVNGGTRNNSLSVGRRASQGTSPASRRSSVQVHPNSLVLVTRRIHHVFAHTVIFLGAVYVAAYLAIAETIENIFWILFSIYMLAMYVIWMAAAWAGYPRGRHSLLVAFMGRFCGGKGELPDDDNDDEEKSGERRGWGYDWSRRNEMQNVNEDEDEAEEAEMMNREVMVMTIPKRRLTVVNA